MAVIKPKRKSLIQKGVTFTYHPPTFKEHKVANFYEVTSAEEMLRLVKPYEAFGLKFIVFDTEGYALKLKSHDMPPSAVRRWIGVGKKAIPVDLPFCISICDGVNCYSLYDTLENRYANFKKLAPLFEDPTIEKIAHNAKFDMHMFANAGQKIVGRIHDTVVLAKLANENRHSFTLWDLAEKHPNGIVKFEYMVDAYKKSAKVSDYRQIPRELLTEYANADVWNCFQVFMDEYAKIVQDELVALYDNELELMIALYAMERYGMGSDPAYEKPLKDALQVVVDEAETAIYKEVGYTFNINSGAQLYQVLLKMGVREDQIQKTEVGNPCFDAKAMDVLAEVHGISLVIKILEYRKVEKLLNTYAVGIYDQRDSEHKVHCSVNQTEATTGRMSITKPALQTLPKKDKRIRRIFLPSPGYKLWFMDLDQIEYRLFAHYAQATGLIEAIKKGWDVHQATAAIIYNVPYADVTEDQRTRAKTINFSLIYGQGDERSAAALKLTMSEARRFKDHYFAMIPEALPFINTVQKVTRARGYVKNFYDRRRRLTQNEVYKAPNALIQGCAADYIKHRLVDMYKFLCAHKYKTRLVNIVHDELLPEIHDTEQFLAPKLRWLLSDFETFRVPITAGAEYGNPSWGEKAGDTEDIGFDPLTEEEMKLTKAFNVFDGSVFDLVA